MNRVGSGSLPPNTVLVRDQELTIGGKDVQVSGSACKWLSTKLTFVFRSRNKFRNEAMTKDPALLAGVSLRLDLLYRPKLPQHLRRLSMVQRKVQRSLVSPHTNFFLLECTDEIVRSPSFHDKTARLFGLKEILQSSISKQFST